MKSSLAAVKRQRFPARASQRVRGLFILGLGALLTWSVEFPLPEEIRIDEYKERRASDIGVTELVCRSSE